MKKTIFIISLGLLLLIIACSKSSNAIATDCSTAKSYSTDVSPIIQSSCATNSGCHASGSSHGPGALTSYAQVFSARTSIRNAVASGTMPQNGNLSSTQRNTILCWIDSGAANN